VDGLLVLLIDVVAHFVTAYAELHGVGGFHGGVEPAPENDAGDEAAAQQGQQ
jgi:hypothetical protein